MIELLLSLEFTKPPIIDTQTHFQYSSANCTIPLTLLDDQIGNSYMTYTLQFAIGFATETAIKQLFLCKKYPVILLIISDLVACHVYEALKCIFLYNWNLKNIIINL